MATTLAQLRARTRYYIDETEDTSPVTWTNAELNQYLNDEQRYLWSTLSKADDQFGLREATASTVQGQTDYVYPSDILGNSVRALYAYTTSSDPQEKVTRGSLEEVFAEGTAQGNPPKRYACLDGYFKVGPPPDSTVYTFLMQYTRVPTTMTVDGSNMDTDDDYAEHIAMGAATRALRRIGRDPGLIEQKRQELLQEAIRSNSPDDFLTAKPAWKY
jgi:hypothetical protein